jgi:hypothetical protein
MIGYRVGLLITLGVVLSVLAPQAQAPTPASPQTPSAGSPQLPQKTTHSVKVDLDDTGTGCTVQKVSPEAIGLYPGDTLVWNIENACSAESKVTIALDPTKRLPIKAATGTMSVPMNGRARLTMEATDLPDGVDFVCGPIDCKASGLPPEVCEKLQPICTCRQPPCPPR